MEPDKPDLRSFPTPGVLAAQQIRVLEARSCRERAGRGGPGDKGWDLASLAGYVSGAKWQYHLLDLQPGNQNPVAHLCTASQTWYNWVFYVSSLIRSYNNVAK